MVTQILGRISKVSRFALRTDGRTTRRTFWLSTVALWLVLAILFVFLETVLGRTSTFILYPPFFWISFGILAKRLHDRDKNSWWMLLLAIPVLGPLWIIFDLGLRTGTRGDNKYGADPRVGGNDYLKLS